MKYNKLGRTGLDVSIIRILTTAQYSISGYLRADYGVLSFWRGCDFKAGTIG